MNIAFLHSRSPTADGTGATHSATQIVEALHNRGHEITVYCKGDRGQQIEDSRYSIRWLETDGIHSNTALNAAIKERVDEFDEFDVVHSYPMASIPAMECVAEQTTAATAVTLNAYGGVCAKNDAQFLGRTSCSANGLLKCTVCSALTSTGHDEYSAAYRFISRMGNLNLIRKNSDGQHIDGFQALSPHVKDTYTEFGFPEERISVIPNIADERFITSKDRRFEPPYSLLYVGYLQQEKGVLNLVPMIAELQNEVSADVRMVIVGNGGLRSKIESQIVSYEVQDTITLAGRVPNEKLPAYYHDSDLFVYPGQWDEPFGRVFLEALGTGTPTISTDVGAAKGILGDAGIVTGKSAADLASAAADVIENDRFASMSTAARTRIKDYKKERVVTQIESFYEQLS